MGRETLVRGYRTVKLENNPSSILEAARTISLAFSNDPLIQWLRPGASPWAQLDEVSLRWQRRRLRRAMREAQVLRLLLDDSQSSMKADAGKLAAVIERAIPPSTASSASTAPIAILYPAQFGWWDRLYRQLWKMYFDLMDRVDPAWDPATAFNRVEVMMRQNHECLSETERVVKPRKLHYLEVMAVRPSMHGQGFGGKLMKAVLERTRDEPIVLECTDKSNIGFYEKYGFEVVREVILEDKTESSPSTLTYWLMVRRGGTA